MGEISFDEIIQTTEREILIAERLIDAGQGIIAYRPLTKGEREAIVKEVDYIASLWSNRFNDSGKDDESLLNIAALTVCCLKISILFMKEPTKENFDDIIKDVKDAENWHSILYLFNSFDCSNANTNWIVLAYEQIYKDMPEDERYDLFSRIYVKGGFDFPLWLVRDIQRTLPKNHLANLPERLRNEEYLTIYRASYTAPDDVGKSLAGEYSTGETSWSLSPSIAFKYYSGKTIHHRGKQCYFYSGEIKPKDIIYYTDKDCEVLQFQGVKNVRCIPFNEMMDLVIKNPAKSKYTSLTSVLI